MNLNIEFLSLFITRNFYILLIWYFLNIKRFYSPTTIFGKFLCMFNSVQKYLFWRKIKENKVTFL
jgi:hypothetical protein